LHKRHAPARAPCRIDTPGSARADDASRESLRIALLRTNAQALGWTRTEAPKREETVEVAGKKLLCTVVERTSVHERFRERWVSRDWLHPDVPGGVAKSELVAPNPPITNEIVEAWGVPGK
jgi:hypothetical protein